MKKVFFISAGCLVLDQLIKGILTVCLSYEHSYEIISNFLSITLVKNTGAAFSIMSGDTTLLIAFTVAVLIAIYFMVFKDHEVNNYESVTYGILIGGILGNLVDRIFNGYVVDYIHFHFLEYNFPIFNLADVFIIVSVIMIIVGMFRRKNETQSRKIWN